MKCLLKLFLVGLFILNTIYAYDAFSIGVSGVENILHSATFYNNKLLYGIDFLHFGMNAESSGTNYYAENNNSNGTSSDGGISVNVFMPRLGYRIPVKSINRINTYNQIEGYIILPMVKGKGDLEEEVDDIDEEIKDALTLMGLKVSHAVEYEFNHQLSLTGSFGLNWIYWDFTQDEDNDLGESSKVELSANLSYTYTMLTLHFKLDDIIR